MLPSNGLTFDNLYDASAADAADDDVIVDVDVAGDVIPKRFHFSHTQTHTRILRTRNG